jgi:hypothetical protein
MFKNIFVANAFISPFRTQTNQIKSFYTQQHCYLCFPKNHIPWRDSNPGLLVPEVDTMSTAPRRQGAEQMSTLVKFLNCIFKLCIKKPSSRHLFLLTGSADYSILIQEPILRLLNLQLQRQRCSRLERLSK